MKVSLCYIGKRINNKGKVCQKFLNGDDEITFTGRIRFVYIGMFYHAEKKGKSDLTIQRSPACDEGREATPAQVSTWEAQEIAALSKKRKADTVKKAKSDPEILRIAKQLSPILASADMFEIGAIVESITNHAWKHAMKKRREK